MPDRPRYTKERAEDIPLLKLIGRMWDDRTAKEFLSYFGPLFDMVLDSDSLLTEMVVGEFVQGDPAAGVDTHPVELTLTDMTGTAVASPVMVDLVAYADADCTTVHPTATIDTETEGSILLGGGTNVLRVKTDATEAGKFKATLSNSADTAVYVVYEQAANGPVVGGRDKSVTITFTP